VNLSTEDADQFYRFMWGLQLYVGKELRLMPTGQTLPEYAALGSTPKIKVRDALWKHPELIDRCVTENPDDLSPEEREIIQRWRRFVAGTFTVFRHLKAHTIFIGKSQVYGVLGLYDPLSQVLAHRPLPVVVETVLLPFKGRIVYDGLTRPYDVLLGTGMRSGLNEEYARAKQRGEILTSLEPDLVPAVPVPPARGLDSQSEHPVNEVLRMSEKLRGGTALQSAALGVLRASARAMQSAVQDPDDLEELRRLSGRVQTALKRLQTTLDRAE